MKKLKLKHANLGARTCSVSTRRASTKKTTNSARQQLFSEERPELYFHKAPGVGKTLPDLSGFNHEEMVQMQYSPIVQTKKGAKHITASDAKRNELYIAPLMTFFQESIDLERTLEIDRQECVLQ